MMNYEYSGELRLPAPHEKELVRKAYDKMLVRNHPKQQGIIYLLCAVGCVCIGAAVKTSYLLWGAALLFLLFYVLLLIQYRIDCDIAQKVLSGRYLVSSAIGMQFTRSDWAGCDAQVEFEYSSDSAITLDLDMTENEILDNGSRQFLLVASEYGKVVLQCRNADVFIYQAV